MRFPRTASLMGAAIFTLFCLLLLLAAAVPNAAWSADTAPAAEERVGIDPVLRGIWVLHTESDDGGVTLTQHNPPKELATVTATAINFGGPDGRCGFERVVIVNDDQGNPGNVVLLETGRFLGISKTPGQPFVLVQVFDNSTGTAVEVTRWVVTVQQ